MRVLCIDATWDFIGPGEPCNISPIEGEVYEVQRAYKDENGEWYEIYGFEEEDFSQEGFIPIEDLEREIESVTIKEKENA